MAKPRGALHPAVLEYALQKMIWGIRYVYMHCFNTTTTTT